VQPIDDFHGRCISIHCQQGYLEVIAPEERFGIPSGAVRGARDANGAGCGIAKGRDVKGG
jgi:hypothetical protein